MSSPFKRTMFLSIVVFFLSACSKNLVVSDGSFFFPGRDIAIAPISVSAIGNSMVVSSRDINFISNRFGIRPLTIEIIGLKEGSYSESKVDEIISGLEPRFEDQFEEFYHLVLVAPANYRSSESDRNKRDLIFDALRVYDEFFRREVQEYVDKYRDDLFAENRAKDFVYLVKRTNPIEEYDNFMLEIDLFRRYVQNISRAKRRISAWLRERKLNSDFTKKIRLTIDMVSFNQEPLITTRRAFATIEEGDRVKAEVVFRERRKDCFSEDNSACRFDYISEVNDQSSKQLRNFVNLFLDSQQYALGLSDGDVAAGPHDPSGLRQRLNEVIIFFNIIVNGRIAEFALPGKFIELEEWHRVP